MRNVSDRIVKRIKTHTIFRKAYAFGDKDEKLF